MTGIPFLIVFVVAIIVMIVMISKFKVHPFLAILLVSLALGIIGGIPLIDTVGADGEKVQGIANVIGAGFANTFTSIGIVIIFGDVVVRVRDDFAPAMHIDTDESNAAGISGEIFGTIIK